MLQYTLCTCSGNGKNSMVLPIPCLVPYGLSKNSACGWPLTHMYFKESGDTYVVGHYYLI